MTFEEAYRQINGRFPSDELTKHALNLGDQSNLAGRDQLKPCRGSVIS
jgi:hypothetical protein